MSRPLRLEIPNGLYHVSARGNRDEPIVEDDADRVAWMDVLQECCARHAWRLYAWCLMTNHYHLLVETPKPNLSAGMRPLNGIWSQAFNRRHRRSGHVFQGRYKAVLVERETHLVSVSRHVVLNPVRTGTVADAADHAWSSHQAMLGVAHLVAPRIAALQREALLARFGRGAEAVERYSDYVRAGMASPSVWNDLQGEVFLGGPGFQRRMLDQWGVDGSAPAVGRWREVPLVQRVPLHEPESLENWAARHPAAEAMARAYESGHYRLAQIADHFGVHPSTVSRAAQRWRTSRETPQPASSTRPASKEEP